MDYGGAVQKLETEGFPVSEQLNGSRKGFERDILKQEKPPDDWEVRVSVS